MIIVSLLVGIGLGYMLGIYGKEKKSVECCRGLSVEECCRENCSTEKDANTCGEHCACKHEEE